MKLLLKKGETSVILTVFIHDSSSGTGAGLGSLDQNSSIIGGYVKRGGLGVALVVDENVTTEGTYQAPSAAGKVRIGTPANMITGVYELHFHDDLFTTADWVIISLGGASNMPPLLIEVQLTNMDLNGVPEVDLTFIGGQAISGNNATLKLKQLDITNSAGTAVVCKSTGSDGIGMDIAGNGTGGGLKATGGATGHGIDGQGGASGGQGLNAKANGGNGAGALFQGKGSGEGLDARGDLTGHGISGLGGVTSGAGIYGQARAGNDAGMELVKHGSGKDLDAATLIDDIWAKAMQDLGAIPGATASALDALNILFMALRNKQTATDGAQTLRNNAGATIATATLSDAAGTTTKEKYA